MLRRSVVFFLRQSTSRQWEERTRKEQRSQNVECDAIENLFTQDARRRSKNILLDVRRGGVELVNEDEANQEGVNGWRETHASLAPLCSNMIIELCSKFFVHTRCYETRTVRMRIQIASNIRERDFIVMIVID